MKMQKTIFKARSGEKSKLTKVKSGITSKALAPHALPAPYGDTTSEISLI